MYYITEKYSETGKKFIELREKIDLLMQANRDLATKYGFIKWTVWILGGYISSVIFDKQPDPKLWKYSEKNKSWSVNKSTKSGKDLLKELQSIPKLYPEDYNAIVGVSERWGRIGVAWNNEDFFGFEVIDKWDYEYPSDCKEVTRTEYRKLFPGIPEETAK